VSLYIGVIGKKIHKIRYFSQYEHIEYIREFSPVDKCTKRIMLRVMLMTLLYSRGGQTTARGPHAACQSKLCSS